jgi:hypothetical protein
MPILSQIETGSRQVGQRIVIAAQEKVGKTTLAIGAPRPLLVPLEIGYAGFDVPKTPMLNSFEDCIALLHEIGNSAAAKRNSYQSIIWDGATALERLIHDAILRADGNYAKSRGTLTMEAAHGGYGKAYSIANEKFNEFTRLCDALAYTFGINTIMTCHVFASRIVDPNSGEFDVWDLLLHSPKNNKNYGKREMMTQWADMIGFLYEPVHVIINDKQQVQRAVTANRGRVLGVDRTPSYVAGNRYRMQGEIPIPLQGGWNYVADAIYKSYGVDLYNRELK